MPGKRPVVPVEVGQVRRDPDKRPRWRDVHVVELVDRAHYGTREPAAVVARAGRRTRVAIRRLERWEVVR